MTLDVQVPTKIVIMGTSSMSLNDRFSKIVKAVVPAAKQVVRPSRHSLLKGGRAAQSRSSLTLGEPEYLEDDLIDDEMMEEEIYDPTYSTLRRTRAPVIQRQRM
ncbi:hypothetical protein PENTCL1PPCAC_20387, partial [Pristionchus entomophagus]